MTRLAEFLAAHGPMLLVGTTALLSAGTIALLLQRAPIHRQRLAEMTVLCVLVWITLACVPLPRWVLKTAAAPRDPTISPLPATPAELPSDWQSVLASLIRPGQSTPQRLADRVSPDASTARAASSQFTGGAPISSPITLSPRWWHLAPATLVATIYLIGATAWSVWLLLGHLLLWRVIRRARRPEPWLSELFDAACRAVGIRRARVLVVRAPLRPVSCGLIRPSVLLGTADCSPANRPRLRQVLLHEAAHLRQRDAWGNALFNLAMPLLYFHPLYWILRSKASLAREMVADDIAAASTSRAAYASDLLELARTRAGYRPTPLAAVGIFRSPSHFYRRMHMLMQRNIRLENRCSTAWKLASGAACAGLLFAATATLGIRQANAQDAPKPVEIKQQKLDQTVLRAKLALNEAMANRDVFLRQVKAGAMPQQLAGDVNKTAAEIFELEADLKVAKNKFGGDSPQVREITTRLDAARDLAKQQFEANRDRFVAAQQVELDSRVALAQKNFDEVQAAQQSVRSAADDDDDADNAKRERDAKQRFEMEKARADAQDKSVSQQLRQQLEEQLRRSNDELAQVHAQLAQAEAQLKVATAQAQQEMKRAQDMLKQHWDKGHQEWSATADQVRSKIDQIILDKIRKERPDSGKGGDIEELVRRTYLDVAGRLPTPEERIATEQALKEHLHSANQYIPKSPEPRTEAGRKDSGRLDPNGAQLNAAVSGLRPQLDLVALATSYADAIGNIAGAQEELNEARSDSHERAAAKAKLVAAEQKAHLLRSITEAALQQAKQEYDFARKRAEAGAASPNDALEAEGRMRILSLILQSSPDAKSSDLRRE